MTNAAATEAIGPQPGPGDLAEIFYAPSAVFARRREGQFGLPYVALVGIGVVLFFATRNLMQPVIDAEISRNMAAGIASGRMTADQAATASSFAKTVGNVGLVVFWIIAPFIIALLTWIAGKVAGVRDVGRVAIMVATFSMFPRLIGSVVGAAIAAAMPEASITSAASVSLSPARFVDITAHPGMAALLGRFDLFLLWGMLLIALGVQHAAGASKGKAWGTAIGVWVMGSLPAIWAALRS